MKLVSNLVNPTKRKSIYLDQVIFPLVTSLKLYFQETRMSHLYLYVPKLIFELINHEFVVENPNRI